MLAAAIVGHADAIVTFNLKDFPTDYVRQFGIEALHPDDFVMNQIDLDQVACLSAIKAMRAGWKAEFVLEILTPEYIDPTLLQDVTNTAGRLVGVGDFRPTYGRFFIDRFEVLGK